MRNLKPKLTIDKFTGSGQGLLFYNEGFTVGNENGNSLLNEGYRTNKIFDNSDAGYTSITNTKIKAVNYLTRKSGSTAYRLMTDGAKFFSQRFTFGVYNGLGISVGTGGGFSSSSFPDMFELASGNLIFSSTNNLGLIVRGSCATGSSTTQIIDSQGRDFTTLGLSTSAPNNKVQNLITGTVHTITSITTTTATNDTLVFSAGTNNAVNDEFIAIVANKWDLTASMSVLADSNQPRQIKQFADRYYVLNSDHLARLDGDETTFNNKSKELPTGYRAVSFDVNADKILVSAIKNNGENALLLWDGQSDGWNNIMPISFKVNCVKSYSSGWLYVLGGILYFTNGFSSEVISKYNDFPENTEIAPNNFNQIAVINNIVYIVNNQTNANRVQIGVYAYDFGGGWTFIPIIYKDRLYGTPQCIYYSDINPFKDIEVGMEFGLSSIDYGKYSSQYLNKSAIWFLDLKDETQVFGIGLNLSHYMGRETEDITTGASDKETKVTVSIGDGKNGIIYTQRGYILPVGQLKTGYTTDNINVGDQVIAISENTPISGLPIAGERGFVSSKTYNPSTEIIHYMDSNFSAVSGVNLDFKVLKVKKCATKDIKISDLNKEQLFFLPSSFYSNKLYIEIVVHGGTKSFPISLTDINVY